MCNVPRGGSVCRTIQSVENTDVPEVTVLEEWMMGQEESGKAGESQIGQGLAGTVGL